MTTRERMTGRGKFRKDPSQSYAEFIKQRDLARLKTVMTETSKKTAKAEGL